MEQKKNSNLRPIWFDEDQNVVKVIDQRKLPHEVTILTLKTVDDIIMAIKEMVVRGAPLIGVTAGYGVVLAVIRMMEMNQDNKVLDSECQRIKSARPTAVNLVWAVDMIQNKLKTAGSDEVLVKIAKENAASIYHLEIENCRQIGQHGVGLIEDLYQKKNEKTVHILTHCNAGWLACVEYGTATAPIYAAHEKGIDVHVWVDETRPLNQGARLTAWELGQKGVKHTVITDNAGGHLMQHGMVDAVIVGTDRTTHTGDVANKIGTYLKALAAKDNGIPFYVALPSSTFDWVLTDGIKEIEIEHRNPDEVRYVQGLDNGKICNVLVPPHDSPVGNFAFDVTPARLVSAFITERGICKPSKEEILGLFPEKR